MYSSAQLEVENVQSVCEVWVESSILSTHEQECVEYNDQLLISET